MNHRLVRPVRQTGPLSPMGRTITRPRSLGPAAPISQAIVRRSPQAFIQSKHELLMPDVPAGVVLDGRVTHIESPRPTIVKKYRG